LQGTHLGKGCADEPIYRPGADVSCRRAGIGAELLQQVVFIGGCATGLLITDKASLESVRYTDDVDIVTHVIGYSQWVQFQEQLSERGFVVSPDDNVICRMRLGELKVDFMPDDASILGFSNRWYADVIEHCKEVALSDGTAIRLITPGYFIATKLGAYIGRGDQDPLASHDIEDLLNVVDGREALQQEIEQAEPVLKTYIGQQISLLLKHRDFEYAVQATARNNPEREVLIFRRLEALAALNKG